MSSIPQLVDRRELRGKGAAFMGSSHTIFQGATTYDFDLLGKTIVVPGPESVIPYDGFLKALRVKISANAITGDCALDIYINGVIQTLTTPLVIPAMTNGVFTNSKIVVQVAAGDTVFLRLTTGGVAPNSLVVETFTLVLDPLGGL